MADGEKVAPQIVLDAIAAGVQMPETWPVIHFWAQVGRGVLHEDAAVSPCAGCERLAGGRPCEECRRDGHGG